MSAGEKKVAALLAIVLVVMVGAYIVTGRSSAGPGATLAQAGGAAGGRAAGGGAAAGGQACDPAPGGAGGGGAIQEYGKAGAKLEVIAVLPVAKGCHATTEQELKKAYEAHPEQIHLTIVDLMGPEATQYKEKVGVGWTVVSINGSYQFELDGRQVRLEKAENMSYSPADIVPIIEAELKKG